MNSKSMKLTLIALTFTTSLLLPAVSNAGIATAAASAGGSYSQEGNSISAVFDFVQDLAQQGADRLLDLAEGTAGLTVAGLTHSGPVGADHEGELPSTADETYVTSGQYQSDVQDIQAGVEQAEIDIDYQLTNAQFDASLDIDEAFAFGSRDYDNVGDY